MKKLILILILYLTVSCYAEQASDTVWTHDLGITGDIYQVQFLPDGQSVAVATGAGVTVFDTQTGVQLKRFNYPVQFNNNPCNSFVITEDGTKLITAHNDATFIVWDWQNVDTIKVFRDIALQGITAYGNNEFIGIGNLSNWNPDSSHIGIYDINTGKLILKSKNLFINSTAFSISRENNLFAIITGNKFNNNQDIFLGNLTTLEKVGNLGYHTQHINDLSFSSDGKYLASASSDGIIKIWDVKNRVLYKSFLHDSNGNDILTVKFSPDSKFIVSGISIWDKWNTKIWKIETSNLIYKYNIGLVSGLDVSENGNYIIGGDGIDLIMLNSHWSPTDIHDQPNLTTQIISPNPASDFIEISHPPLERGSGGVDIKIYNIFGQILTTPNPTPTLPASREGVRIDVSGLAPGMYFLRIGKTVVKFIKL